MVYAFALPSTSHIAFQTFLSSSTHPALPQAASTARHALRVALKALKRLPRASPQYDAQLSSVLAAITEYLPYLLAIAAGISGTPLATPGGGEEVEIALRTELESEWRATLSASSSARAALKRSPSSTTGGRVRGPGIDFELAFVLTTLGYVRSGLARSRAVRTLYAAVTPSADQRVTAIQEATRSLLQASAVHSLLASSPSFTGLGTWAVDVDPATQAALSSLAMAEATLLAVWKDDAYVAACIQARNPHDKEWMVRAPEIPKVRVHLFARLCIRAAEYAEQAEAGLGSVGVDEDLVKYARVLSRVARARACRFFGIDAELAGKIGEGIAWLQAAKGVMGVRGAPVSEEQDAGAKAKSRGFSRLKQGWMERREERRMEKDAGGRDQPDKGELGPGDNAGREEEGRVIEMLETKWVRMNDTMNTQRIPPSTDLLASLPSGRDIHPPPGPYQLPVMDEEQLVRMRAPPSEDDFLPESDPEDSDKETDLPLGRSTPGAFPERSDSAYY